MCKIKNYCGIFAEERLHLSKVQANLTLRSIGTFFATAFVTTTIILLASCSQDDDYYDSDMYTLAEMGTRLAEGGESGDPGGGGTYVYPTSEEILSNGVVRQHLDDLWAQMQLKMEGASWGA